MNLVSLSDWSPGQIEEALRLSFAVKEFPEQYARSLAGRTLLMIFQKPSLRTRVSFEAAMLQLGGHAIYYDLATSPWGAGKETPADTARTVSRYVDAVMARLFHRADMKELADHAPVPVINGLTDFDHPCQALADLMTLQESTGRLTGLKLAYLGDGLNNVTHSLMDGCARVGIDLSIACPEGKAFEPAPEVLDRARAFASRSGSRIQVVHEARPAATGADAVYTDTWMSYHIPPERREERMGILRPYRVTADLMRQARSDAVFMHCLPAQRGMEVEAEVLDGPQSVVFDQAENRLHTGKALLLMLSGRT